MPLNVASDKITKKAAKKLLEKVLKEKNISALIKQGYTRKEAESIIEKEDLMKKESENEENKETKEEENKPFKGITIKIELNNE